MATTNKFTEKNDKTHSMSITETDLDKMGIASIGTKRKNTERNPKVEDCQFDIFDYK